MLRMIEQTAVMSVARGCGFAALGIATMMFGMSANHISTAFSSGGILCLLVCMILMLKSYLLHQRNYRQTELWLMLDPENRPHEAIAPVIIVGVLRETYLKFAQHASAVAAAFLILALLLAR